ncbi:Uncharacterized protein with LysM domain, COG1652 [hydrothermal vent metagenome]|uniref:Uncharacterized protein with LysM domain, COG1652 n=1 Tax=hydrothermal vent metagenome TaxID=652676 RepID=A0A3B1B487_9ZZZZ
MPHSRLNSAGIVLGLLLSCSIFAAESVPLNPTHPDRHVVVKGDTLWDIAGKFLQHPWQWPEIWQANPQIANPHLIYPGDIIVLSFAGGKPRLSIQRGPGSRSIKLSPHMRSVPLDTSIPTIPMGDIQPFLAKNYALDKAELDAAPYVVGFKDEHIAGTTGKTIYVRSINTNEHSRYDVIRPGEPYKDADTGEILGYEGIYIGAAELQRTGDPASLYLLHTKQEVLPGDRLLPASNNATLKDFFPRVPVAEISGSIIDLFNGVNQIGQYNIVVLDRGTADGLTIGDVLAVDQRGETVFDRVDPNPQAKVTLPDEEAGILMVFRTFPRVSFGIIMSATTAINVLDKVRNP